MAARYQEVPGLAAFADLLATEGVRRGLIGPREVPRLWPRHLANCAVVAEEERERIPTRARVADVGSGAGLPGIVWALVRPDMSVCLIEPLLRRATFLSEAVSHLGLESQVTVVRSRAEDIQDTFDVVTARAVARLPQLLAWTLPLTAAGGWVIAMKGAGASDEVAEARQALRRLGGGVPIVAEYGAEVLDPPTIAVLVQRTRPNETRSR